MGPESELEIPAKVCDSEAQAPSAILNLMAHGSHLASSLHVLFGCRGEFLKNRNQYFT